MIKGVRKTYLLLKFLVLYFRDLTISAFRIALDIVTVKDLSQPGVVAVPLDAETDVEITLIANLITFSPGTMVVDLSEDKKTIFVHTMFLKNEKQVVQSIKGTVERRVLEIMR